MAITPQTDIRLLKVPFGLDNKNQLTFANVEAQTNYFLGLEYTETERTSYQRKDNLIRYPAHIDSIINYNYVMYKNNNYTDKWFYAFITKMEYVNDNMTYIYIQTDVFQTWQFNLIYKSCFIEREHVNDDTVGKNTVPEGLETGEYIIDNITSTDDLSSYKYVIQVSEPSTDGAEKYLATNFGGIFMAGGAYICDTIQELVNIVQTYQNGREDAILNVYIVPSFTIKNTSGSMQYSGQTDPGEFTINLGKPTSLDNYIPKNKKLLTYPYCFLNLSNNNGSIISYNYEDFKEDSLYFKIKGVPVCGASIKCVPQNYKISGDLFEEDYGLLAGKYPTLSWSNDPYTNWLTQNAVNIGVGFISSGASIISSLATGNPVGIVGGGLSIANQLGEMYAHSIAPDTVKGNTNGADINVSSKTNMFYFEKMSIKKEYAKIIDDFFSMFGYKVNSVKVPNITGRQNWNYVKTNGANIEGDIPQEDLQSIKDMFDNGVTFWHNSSTFLDYSQSNNIN